MALYGSKKKAPVDIKGSPVLNKKSLKAKIAKMTGGKQVTFRDVVGSNNPRIAKAVAKGNLFSNSVKAKLKNVWKQLSN